MSEASILAYFKSPEEAQKVAKQIKDLGVSELQIDRINSYSGGSADLLSNPLTGDVSSLASITLGSGQLGKDSGVLLSSDVSASGMSDGGQNPISGTDILLAAVVDEQIQDQVKEIIKNAGGIV